MTEARIHATICKHLAARAVPDLLWWHTPNGGKRNPIEAAIFKGQGVLAGVADICALHAGKFHALEIKRDAKARVSPAQHQFIAAVRQAGGRAEIGRGLDQCLRILEQWKLLRGRVM